MGFDSRGQPVRHDRRHELVAGHRRLLGQQPAADVPDRAGRPRPSSQHCGGDAYLLPGRAPDGGQHQRLQRQDAADQADRRRSRTASQPPVGIGTTYTIPGASAPNGPNLFSGTEGNGDQAKPEIYAMGLRNPSRLSIDPKTDVAVHGVGRSRRRRARAPTLGPSTYENAAQITTPATTAGRTAWAASRPTATGSPTARRARPTPRLRAGRPGGRRHRRLVRLRQPHQRLDPQHRPDRAPAPDGHRHATPARCRGRTSGTAAATRTARNGCPEFPRERGVDGAPNYGATPRQLCPYATANGATIMNGPLYRYDDDASDDSRALAASTGTGAGSCTTTAARASSTGCCSIRRPTRTAASRCTPTACATR